MRRSCRFTPSIAEVLEALTTATKQIRGAQWKREHMHNMIADKTRELEISCRGYERARQEEGSSASGRSRRVAVAKDSSFTGQRLDLLRAVRMDRTVTDSAYRVMSVIVDHINAGTERTKLSDATIAFEAGCADRSIRRARRNLAEAGWLKWARTGRKANIYWARYNKVAPLLAMLDKERAAKREKFNKTAENSDLFGQKWPITPQSEAPANSEVSQNSGEVEHDRPEMAERATIRSAKNGRSDRRRFVRHTP